MTVSTYGAYTNVQWGNAITKTPQEYPREKLVYYPYKPPMYFVDLQSYRSVNAWPTEIITSATKELYYSLCVAQVVNEKMIHSPTCKKLLENYNVDYEEFKEKNPWVAFFVKNQANYQLGARVLTFLSKAFVDITGRHPVEYGRYYTYVVSAVPFITSEMHKITQVPDAPTEFKSKTTVGSYRKLMRAFPFKDKSKIRWLQGEMPFWWLYEVTDDMEIEDKELYQTLSGRA